MDNLLEVEDLRIRFQTPKGSVTPVEGVSFSLGRQETLALVGESGSGKTITSMALLRLLDPTAQTTAGLLRLDGRDLLTLNREELRKVRGSRISMIFQEPMTSLNPVYRIDRQIGEVYRIHSPHMPQAEIHRESVEMLHRVGVPNPEERLRVYPHQLSGGLRQRVMIAIALAAKPQVLIADEPTTALDVTIQAQILSLLKSLQAELQMSILLITHDFGVVSQIADRVAVMYAGNIVEEARCAEIFADPWHPYTQMLIMSIPGIKVKRGGRLEAIPGIVPDPAHFPPGCRFYPRCPRATERCALQAPPLLERNGRKVRCFEAVMPT